MAMEVFFRSLTLVSGLAQALVYGLGGYLAVQGRLDPGHGRHDGPAAQPAVRAVDRARHGAPRRGDRLRQLRAGLRGARHRAADRRADDPRGAARRARRRRARRRPLRLSVGRPGVAGIAGGGRRARRPGRRGGAPRHLVPRRAGPDRRPGRPVGRRQVDARRRSCRGCTTPTPAPCASPGSTCATCRSTTIRHTVGVVTQDGHLFHDTIRRQPAVRRAGRHRRRAVGRARAGPAG